MPRRIPLRPRLEARRSALAAAREAVPIERRATEIAIRGEVTWAKCQHAIRLLKHRPLGEVRIVIDSHGGSATGALDLARALRAHRGPTEAHVEGIAASAAAYIMLAAQWRTAEPGAKILFHPAAIAGSPAGAARSGRLTAETLRRMAAVSEKVDGDLRELLEARLGARAAAEIWVAGAERERYYDALEAFARGILSLPPPRPRLPAHRSAAMQAAILDRAPAAAKRAYEIGRIRMRLRK